MSHEYDICCIISDAQSLRKYQNGLYNILYVADTMLVEDVLDTFFSKMYLPKFSPQSIIKKNIRASFPCAGSQLLIFFKPMKTYVDFIPMM